ncbi:MAG TPA: hypothetical protein PKN80_02905 [bacterium]|uniref:Uroporphyrinogen decarboxylase (URO-D) domain-containing protein n=1 Tax=candidate division TA06 bacterium ADurb.Bin417 TaxID=1852828 RepID=A0A1V5MKB0_UNCT6|nr:MAG: hypothetical protein BWY73_00162 [candidate division TA06 bacterium ADurb.Bin417]HNQ34994.1 hypothetical protein [bacterium]HNS49251.1 hypothetical protein [bacterium]
MAETRNDEKISSRDREILRRLAEAQAAIADLPVQSENAERWRRVNALQPARPPVLIFEIPWGEYDIPELALQAEHPFCRNLELNFRRLLYQWRNFPGEMVVENRLYCPLVIRDSGFGLAVKERTIPQGPAAHISSHLYEAQLQDEADLEKIKPPVITLDRETTELRFQQMRDLFDGILPVEKRGRAGGWFAPWDLLVRWWGVEAALADLVLRPALIHQAMDRLVNAYLAGLDQLESQNLLALNNANDRVGSGGLGYTDQLPAPGFDPAQVRTIDLWGGATAQIFSEVSPRMHEEFALEHELPWLARFGLNYYGCCEPLHHKIGILKRIPRLRKISMSPRARLAEGAAAIGGRYVFSLKPNPASLAGDDWNPERVRAELRQALEAARGCAVEIILKDISTTRGDPRRLADWARVAAEVTAAFA